MAIPGIKVDDGAGGFATNCFPVRGLLHQGEEGGGAWLVAQKAEQRRRFKAVLCAKPRTYSRIREERKRAEKQGTHLTFQGEDDFEGKEKEEKILDGFFLMKHCCVEDPSHLCSVNIAGEELSDVKEEDFTLFDNVAYVNAGENYLPFEAFRGFPIIRELELPLNGLRSLKIGVNDFPSLEMLDLSYNNLSEADILTLGILPNLRVLHLTGNNFRNIPAEMCLPFLDAESKSFHPRYEKLEILMLDENKLADYNVFAALAGLQRLRQLSLEKNEIYFVPQLKSLEGKLVIQEDKHVHKKSGRSSRKSSKTPRSGARSARKSANEVKDTKSEIGSTVIVETEEPSDEPVVAVKEPVSDAQEITPKQDDHATTEEDLTTEDLKTDAVDLSAKISELNMEAEIEGKATATATEASLPPFPELRLLNLANNQIENEEALLAVAAWPMLVELVVHDNPLTTERSGDPPLLKKFLHDRLGVNLIRKREKKTSKPGYEVPTRESRFVNTVVPKIPKVSVDELLMLEAPKPHPPKQSNEEDKTRYSGKVLSKPLPPIKQAIEELNEEPDLESLPTDAWNEEDENKNADDNRGGETFFMTQVDDQDAERPRPKPSAERQHPRKKRVKKIPKHQNDERYKGFEMLMDIDSDVSDTEDPKDIQGNVRALKYALNHQRVYRDAAVHLDSVRKPVPPYKKPEPVTGKPIRTKSDKMEDVLHNLKHRTTHEEANLADVFEDKQKLHKQFPEAKKLLCEVQRRYNAVRVNSMKDAKDARKNLQTAAVPEKKHTVQPIAGKS